MNYKDIVLSINNNNFSPIYFLMGDEDYYIDQLTALFTEKVLSEDEKAFNQTILYGKDTEVNQIISESKQFPIGAEKRLIIIKEAQNLKNIESLDSYFNNPQKSTILVLAYKNKSIDRRKKFGKELNKKCILFESKKLYDNQISSWVKKYLEEKQISIEEKASIILAEYLGNNLSKIKNELDKLLLVINKKEKINSFSIEKHIGISKDYNIFELQNALGNRNLKKISLIINHFNSNEKRYNPILSIISLFHFFQKIFIYKSLKNKKEASRILKINPFFLKQYENAARNYSNKQLFYIFELLKKYDLKSKGVNNKTKNNQLLKELTLKILHL